MKVLCCSTYNILYKCCITQIYCSICQNFICRKRCNVFGVCKTEITLHYIRLYRYNVYMIQIMIRAIHSCLDI